MLMKRIGKLRRKKGAVLFAVIAIMSLLIAMASTAYYSAKSSYNSVVSNYNYSQLYLSAISVSDMIIDSMTNDALTSASGQNVYKPLKDGIDKLKNAGEVTYAYSQNITNPAATKNDIIREIANGNPAINAVVDGVVVEIKVNTVTPDPLVAGMTIYDYSFTTTAYYRGSYVSVEDIVERKVKKPKPADVTFDTFFTATGQELDGSGITRTSRKVIIEVHEVSDDAFFQNDITYFPSHNNNLFQGSLSTTGSLVIDKFTTPGGGIPAGNDWWIGKDLVLGQNGNKMNLSNNNLYVGNDLYLCGNGAEITAKDIYVMGDLYLYSGGTVNINSNLHVSGNIYYLDSEADPEGAYRAAQSDMGDTGIWVDAGGTNSMNVSGSFDLNGENKTPASIPSAGTFDPDAIIVDVTNHTVVTDGSGNKKFDDVTTQQSVTDAIQSQVGTNDEYANYTYPDAYANKVEIDVQADLLAAVKTNDDGSFGGYNVVDGDGYKIEVGSGSQNKNVGSIEEIIVTIEYDPDGILLDLADTIKDTVNTGAGQTNVKFVIESGADPFPIVLADNITNGSGGPAFSWKGSARDAACESQVCVEGTGSVAFEMATIDSSGNYVPYDPTSYDTLGSVQYITGNKEIVGTDDQVSYIDSKGFTNDENQYTGMLQTGTSVPQAKYQNQIMLISNVNKDVAIDSARQNNAFCGYLYAPNGEFNNNSGSGNAPFFGGMIVSTYHSTLSKLVYAEPDPNMISNIIGSAPTPTPPGTKTETWEHKGNNYIG